MAEIYNALGPSTKHPIGYVKTTSEGANLACQAAAAELLVILLPQWGAEEERLAQEHQHQRDLEALWWLSQHPIGQNR